MRIARQNPFVSRCSKPMAIAFAGVIAACVALACLLAASAAGKAFAVPAADKAFAATGDELAAATLQPSDTALEAQSLFSKKVTPTLGMKGDAKKSGKTYTLTPAQTWQGGAVWIKNRIKVKEGLTIKFQYRVTNWKNSPLGHADGIMLNLSQNLAALGSQGENMGFVGAGAYGVELDSFQNYNDPYDPHVAIVKDDVSNHLATKTTSLAVSSKWRTVTVTYKKNTLTVKIGLKKIVSKKGVTLPSYIYAGITASTGDGFAKHQVRNFRTNAAYAPVTSEGKLAATKSLKKAKYKTLAQVRKDYKKSMSWATKKGLYVPGVDAALVDGKICKNMVPQGICATWQYLLITAYCKEKGSDGHPAHNSVIYVLDKQNGELLTTITLKGTRTLSRGGNHVGGIAYDGINVWIATSGYLPDGKNIGELWLTIDEIDDAVQNGKTSISTKGKYVPLTGAGKNTAASFNVYYGGYLWVGYFIDELDANGKQKKGTLTGYTVGERTLQKGPVLKISDNANGATFLQRQDGTYLIVNKSTGRYKSTKAYSIVYKVDDVNTSTDLTKAKYTKAKREVPRMMEEVTYDGFDNTLYMITESAAKEYRGNGYYPTNVIFGGSADAFMKGIS